MYENLSQPMFARSTTIMADRDMVGSGIRFVRDEVWKTVRDIDGCLGFSMLVDRETGRSITTTSWLTMDDMQASAGAVGALRTRGADLMHSAATLVEEWEIASMHRAHTAGEGTCVRTAWSKVPANYIGRAIDFYKHSLLGEVEQLDGFVSASLMVDRAQGRGVTSVAFESRAAMEGTRDQADYLRARSTNEAQVEFLDVAEFELVIAHLRVPELV